jgi:hypothetical protein
VEGIHICVEGVENEDSKLMTNETIAIITDFFMFLV